MAPSPLSLILLSLISTLLLLTPIVTAQSAPGPTPSGPIDINAILKKAGNYNVFIRLLNETQAAIQINNQVNNSHDGMTVFAPTDNAFNNLPPAALNNLTDQQHVQLVLYHICPKYYSMDSLMTVSNPVRTQASGQDGGVFGLYITAKGNQVNVSSGIVDAPVYNALSKDFPLAVYQVDQVLLPKEFYEAKPPSSSPPSPKGGAAADSGNSTAPATANPAGNGSGKMNVGMGLVSGVLLFCMGLFF